MGTCFELVLILYLVGFRYVLGVLGFGCFACDFLCLNSILCGIVGLFVCLRLCGVLSYYDCVSFGL